MCRCSYHSLLGRHCPWALLLPGLQDKQALLALSLGEAVAPDSSLASRWLRSCRPLSWVGSEPACAPRQRLVSGPRSGLRNCFSPVSCHHKEHRCRFNIHNQAGHLHQLCPLVQGKTSDCVVRGRQAMATAALAASVAVVRLGLSGSLLLWRASCGPSPNYRNHGWSLRKERPPCVAPLAGGMLPLPVWLPGIQGSRVECGPQLWPSGLGNCP